MIYQIQTIPEGVIALSVAAMIFEISGRNGAMEESKTVLGQKFLTVS
jgi:hypothetical protein